MVRKKSQEGRFDDKFLEKLFGDVTELSDEELDLLYGVAPPGESPEEAVYRIAEQAAVEYRKLNLPLPEHVHVAIQATRPLSSLDAAKPGFLKNLVDNLKKPLAGPVNDPAFQYHKRTELTERDRAILGDLTDELTKDWKEEKPE